MDLLDNLSVSIKILLGHQCSQRRQGFILSWHKAQLARQGRFYLNIAMVWNLPILGISNFVWIFI